MSTFDMDRLLYHSVQADILTEDQAKIAKKIYQGQRVIPTAVPGLLRLQDETAVTQDDLDAFSKGNILDLLLAGNQ